MLFSVPQGKFLLNRAPYRTDASLQAIDAADEFLLNHLADDIKTSAGCRLLIVNDSFGALTVALHSFQPTFLSDSWLSKQATRHNLNLNALPDSKVHWHDCLEPLTGFFDLAVIKIPKSLALLESQLLRIKPQLKTSSQVLLAGMVKHMPPSLWRLLETILGPTETSLARKKARLIKVHIDSSLTLPVNPYPVYYTLEGTDYRITNHANVFSRDKLDIGTRFLLQYVPSHGKFRDIVDLGCGNGVVGLIAAERNPAAELHFVDESYMAIASARENFQRAFGSHRTATFTVGDVLRDFRAGSANLILCNPPFHQQHVVGTSTARNMIAQSKKILRKNGELWLIGNRHLHYRRDIDRYFGTHAIVASNPKFVILKAVNDDR